MNPLKTNAVDYDLALSHSNKALINRIGAPYTNNWEGATAYLQYCNLYQVAFREVMGQEQTLNDYVRDLKVEKEIFENQIFDKKKPHTEFIAKQILNPLARAEAFLSNFNGNLPFSEEKLESFFEEVKKLKFSSKAKIQIHDSLAFHVSLKLPNGGHAMFMEITRKEDGQIEVKFFNTGLGKNYHQTVSGNRIHSISYTLTQEQFFDSDRKGDIRDLIKFLRRENQSNLKGDSRVTKEFYRRLDSAFGVKKKGAKQISNKTRGAYSYRHQLVGDCTAKSLSVWAHNKFKEGTRKKEVKESSYYAFKLALLSKDRNHLQWHKTKLDGLKMKVFFRCFRCLNSFYLRLKKKRRWFLLFFIRVFFMHYTKKRSRIEYELKSNIDRKIKICQTKIASLDRLVAPVA